MKHLSIARRIALAFAVVLTCAVGLGAVAIDRLDRVEEAAKDMRSHWLPQTRTLGQLLFLAQRFRVIEGTVATAPADARAAEARTLVEISDEIDKTAAVEAAIARDEGEKSALAEFDRLWKAYLELDTRFRRATDGGYDEAASELYRGDMRQAIRKVQEALGKAVADNVANGDAAAERSQRTGHDAFVTIVAMIAAAVVFSLAAGWGLARAVARPIAALTQAMTRLAAGHRDVEIPALDLSNELGAMARATAVFRDNSLARRDELERQADTERAAAEAERQRAHAERASEHAALSNAMGKLGASLRDLAAGRLDQRLDGEFSPAYARVRDDFNEATGKLGDAMTEVVGSAEAIASGAKEIASAAGDLSHRTEQQAASLEETAAALAQITSALQKSAASVDNAREVVAGADADAKRSAEVVRRAIGAMDGIARSAGEIGRFIGLIDEIAFQTSLLALNAGVEAARAGDSGRGFAVVAAEVRGLALRSAGAAKEIKALIETSDQQVKAGVDLVGETGQALTRIVEEISRINGIVNEIASGAKEQAGSLDEVNIAVREMDGVTQQNAAMAEQSTAATVNLTHEATRLTALVAQFRVAGGSAAPAAAPAPRPAPPRPASPRPTPTAKPAARLRVAGGRAKAEDWSEF